MGYYQRARFPKPEIRALTRKRKEKLDARAERECRKLVEKRDDKRCKVPTCRRSGRHLHHIVYRSHSSALRWHTSNCLLLCVDHHRLEHAGEITITGNADVRIVVTGNVDLLKFRL